MQFLFSGVILLICLFVFGLFLYFSSLVQVQSCALTTTKKQLIQAISMQIIPFSGFIKCSLLKP